MMFDYDDDGLMIQAGELGITRDPQHGMITSTVAGNVSTGRTHNGFGELETYGAYYNTASLYSVGYMRDKLGRITEKTETIDGSSKTYEYKYDLAGRLEEVWLDTQLVYKYEFDENGNRLKHIDYSGGSPVETTGSYDDQDRMLSYGDATYTYSDNGDLESKTEGADETFYEYDSFGNLRNVTLPDGTVIEYVIDGENRRIGKKVNGVLEQGFLYKDYFNPIAELDSNNNVISIFVYGSKMYIPDYIVKEEKIYRIISDHIGTVKLVIDIINGDVVQKIDYDEFGNVTIDTNPGFQPFYFAGGLYDVDTGLSRFGERDYDPETGRWTIKDKIGFSGGSMNLYSYINNNPINYLDPTGRIIPELIELCSYLFGGYNAGKDAEEAMKQDMERTESKTDEVFCKEQGTSLDGKPCSSPSSGTHDAGSGEGGESPPSGGCGCGAVGVQYK